MYNLQVTVHEYLGCVGVSAALSELYDEGRIVMLAHIPEAMYEHYSDEENELDGLFRALRAFAEKNLNPGRVALGVSQKTVVP